MTIIPRRASSGGRKNSFRPTLGELGRATGNSPASRQRAIGRVLLKIIPDRASLVRCYGQPDFDTLAPVFVAWLRASRPAREAIDAYDAQEVEKTAKYANGVE